jgi:hypothetical protein
MTAIFAVLPFVHSCSFSDGVQRSTTNKDHRSYTGSSVRRFGLLWSRSGGIIGSRSRSVK